MMIGGMGGGEIARMFVAVGAKTSEYKQGMQAVKQGNEEIRTSSQRMGEYVKQNYRKIGAAAMALGAGIEALARKQAPLTQQTRQLARSMDMTEDEMRSLVTSVTDATFSIEDALGVMEKGRQQGIRNAEQLKEYAQFWDMVSDATGESAVRLAESGAALRAVGIDAGNEAEALDALGYIFQETSSDVGEFLYFIERTGPELREMGMDIEDAAAIVGALEGELGMAGRTARSEFRQAIRDADGSMEKMLDTLGLTEEQFQKYIGTVEDSGEAIEKSAEDAGELTTTLEKLQAKMHDIVYEQGNLVDGMGNVSVALMGLLPLMEAARVAKKLWAAKTKILTGAIAALNVSIKTLTMTAGGLIALGVAFVAGMEAWRKKINEVFEETSHLAYILRNFPNIFLGPLGVVQNAIDIFMNWEIYIQRVTDALNWLIGVLNRIPAVDIGMIGGTGFDHTGHPALGGSPGLATGGTITGSGTAWVGERGPELLHLPKGAQVEPLGAGGVTITGNTFHIREDRDIELVARELHKLQKQRSRGV